MVYRILAAAAWLAMLWLSACTSTRVLLDPSPCLEIDDTTVRLRGPIDADMQACAARTLTPQVSRIVVNTPGGSTDAGRTIARQIAALPRTLVIDGECSSSCGNYFVPAAVKLEATPGSYIAIHGTPDPALMEASRRQLSEALAQDVLSGNITEGERRDALDDFQARKREELAAEQEFAETFRVPPGWRLYREMPQSTVIDALSRHFQGAPRPVREAVSGRAVLIVEPTLLESCLSHVDPGNYRTNFEATVYGDARNRAAIDRRGGVFSGTLTCKRPKGAPSS